MQLFQCIVVIYLLASLYGKKYMVGDIIRVIKKYNYAVTKTFIIKSEE